jgi:hypothetical protein
MNENPQATQGAETCDLWSRFHGMMFRNSFLQVSTYWLSSLQNTLTRRLNPAKKGGGSVFKGNNFMSAEYQS